MKNLVRTSLMAVSLSVFIAGSVQAEDEGDALLQTGIALRREHRDAEALEQFRRAYALRPSVRIRAQIALAEQALGQWVTAEKDLTETLAEGDDPWIARHAETLRNALQTIQMHLASLGVQTNVAGAELWLNGNLVGELPMPPARVVVGPVRIEVRAAGYPSVSRVVDALPKGQLNEVVDLTAPKPSPASPSASAALPKTPVHVPPLPSSPPTIRRTAAFMALGAAGAFLTEALVAQTFQWQRTSQYNDDGLCFYGSLSRDQRCGTYRSQAEAAQLLANVGYIGGLSFGVAATVLFVTAPPAKKQGVLHWWIAAAPSEAAVNCAGLF
jgi:hypothetical protein